MVGQFKTLTLILAFTALLTPMQAHADEPIQFELTIIETDAIEPAKILHRVKEIVIVDYLEQRYNYYIYYFEKYGAFLHARAYFENNGIVSIYGPFSDNKQIKKAEAPKLYNEVLAYMKRRFLRIEALGPQGYVTLWKQPELE